MTVERRTARCALQVSSLRRGPPSLPVLPPAVVVVRDVEEPADAPKAAPRSSPAPGVTPELTATLSATRAENAARALTGEEAR